MMNKSVVRGKITEKRSKWVILEELHDRNDTLDEALCILDSLKELISKLPDKLTTSGERTEALVEAAMILDASLDKYLETTGVHFSEIENKLVEMQKILLHEEIVQTQFFSKLTSEIRYKQKRVDALIARAEEDIYKFLESEDFYVERQKNDVRIMEIVFSS